jgi:hypothetical protein
MPELLCVCVCVCVCVRLGELRVECEEVGGWVSE